MKHLLGQWTGKEDDSRWLISVSSKKGRISISVSDKIDGEIYVVKNVGWSPSCLWFNLVVPSTGYKTFNKLHVIKGSQSYCEISYEEEWKRINRTYLSGDLKRLGKRSLLVGEWRDFEEESPTLIKITKRGNGVKVVARDLIQRRDLLVTNQLWKENSLTFATRGSREEWPIKSRLTAVSRVKIIHGITIVEIMKRVKSEPTRQP